MRLKLYRAAGMQAAMAQARAELGPDAIILATRQTATGIELTAALEAAPPPQPAAPPLAAALAWHGVPPTLACRLTGPLEAALAAAFRFAPLPVGPQPLILVGAPGAGKTLAVARLATRAVLAGQTPTVITTDTRRAGAAAELGAITHLLGIPLIVAGDPATLVRALRRAGTAPTLIDTAGVNPQCRPERDALAALAAAANAAPVAVLPAGQHPDEAAEHAAAFAAIGAAHLLASKLDIGRRLGGLVAAAHNGMAFTEAGTGAGVSDGLTSLTPAFLAGRLSRGADA